MNIVRAHTPLYVLYGSYRAAARNLVTGFTMTFTRMHYGSHSKLPYCSSHHSTTQYSKGQESTVLCCEHYTTPRYITLHFPTLHFTIFTTLHYTIFTTLQCTTLHYTSLHYTTLHYTTLHYTTLHYTTLHYTTLHYPKLRLPHQ